MFLIYCVLISLLIGFVNFLIKKFKKDKVNNRKFYDFGDNNMLVLSVILLILAYFGINMFMSELTFASTDNQIQYGEKTSQPWLVSASYRQLVQKDPLNLDLNFKFIQSHFDDNQYLGPSLKKYNEEENFISNYYTSLSKEEDPVRSDIGKLFLGIYYYFQHDQSNCKYTLKEVNNQNIKYLNTYLGLVNYYYHETKLGKENLLKEIKLNGYKEGAYYHLSRLYNYEKDWKKLTTLVYTPEARPFLPSEFRTLVYIKNADIKSYFLELFSNIFKNTNFLGFSGAVLILLIWIMYLHRINLHNSNRWFSSLMAVALSAILIIPVWLLYDFYEYGLGFELNGEMVNDFLYCVFGIGVIEELVKIIPFLIILRFTKAIREPIDYIMYASLCALGFAFVENLHYLRDGKLNIMHTRALTASIAHMIDSSIIAYGLILAKFRYKRNQFLYFIIFFFIAAFVHGFYDFWVLNKVVSEYYLFTFLCLLTSILVYASFINNALNNPTQLQQNIQLNPGKLASDLAASLIGIFLFEYISLSWIYGPTIGKRELLTSTLGGGYLILFLSIRLSNIDVFPGEWDPINFFVGLTPVQIIYGDKKPNFNSILGQRIRIRVFRKKGLLNDILPVEGEIVKRLKISGFSGWFLVKLDKPIPISKSNKDYILVRAKNWMDLLDKKEEKLIYFNLIPDLALLEKEKKNDEDFKFVDWAIAG